MLADVLVVAEESVGRGYADQGTFQLGGSVAGSWADDEFRLDFGPSFGYFPVDHVEVSLLVRLAHVKLDDEEAATTGLFVIEPSYHAPLDDDEDVFLFGGVGVGAGYDGRELLFAMVPRLGYNASVGRTGVLTSAVGMPVAFRGEEIRSVGFSFEMGVGTVL